MSKTFRPWKIDEPLLLPPTVQDFVGADHLARFVLSLVREAVDLARITGTYGSERGQPPHLGEAGPHPVVASAARELLNKSDNERSGVLSTAMSFLGLYRDPVVARVTRRCDWRIVDLIAGDPPATLYLVVPPSDISRTKPLIRLVLNQIGRRLTEELHPKNRRHRLLLMLMLDEFPALGRLDFFESALAFMAGY